MKFRIIDDNEKLADELCRTLRAGKVGKCEYINTRTSPDIFTLAETIRLTISDETVLLINVNLIVGNEKRQTYQGTELLTWLRIKGIMNHCLLYSFQSLESLVRKNSKNLLLLSRGTSFVHLPNDFADAVRQQTQDRAEKENLKMVLRAIFNVGQFRHMDANWWGVKVLWDVHKIASGGNFSAAYPVHVQNKLSNLNNAVGVYLHGLEAKDITRFIEEKKERLTKLDAKLSAQKEEVEHAQLAIQEEREVWEQLHGEILNTIKDVQQARLYSHGSAQEELRQGNVDLKEQKAAALAGRDEAKKAYEVNVEELRRISREIEDLRQLLSSFDSSVRDDLFKEQALPVIEKSKILLIDDNAENGWEDIFKAMFKTDIKSVVPPKEYKDNIDGLYAFLKDKIEEIDLSELPSMIFLDLRLYNEIGRSIDLENISGKKLLGKIRSEFRGIPIIITTASNKIWTFQKLIELGADAYWVKEGLDELRGVEDSVRNYIRLLSLVARMTDGRFQLLKKISSYAQLFQDTKSTHWSNSVTWINGEETRGKVDNISEALTDSLYVIKSYLYNYHLGYGHNSKLNEPYVLSGLINKIAGVYELVHGIDPRSYKNVSYLRDVRGDLNLDELRDLRNAFSHANYLDATWEDLEDTISAVSSYLNTQFSYDIVTNTVKKALLFNNEITIICDDGTTLRISFDAEKASKAYNSRQIDCTDALMISSVRVARISYNDNKLLPHPKDRNEIINSVLGSYGKNVTVKFDVDTQYDGSQLTIKYNNNSGRVLTFSPASQYRLGDYIDRLKTEGLVCRVANQLDGSLDFIRDDYIKLIGGLECSSIKGLSPEVEE